MNNELQQIARQFPVVKDIQHIKAFGSGHINDTYLLHTSGKNFVLQRINHQIFTNVEGLTDNILQITRFINENHNAQNIKLPGLFPTQNGEYLYKDTQNNYWRLMSFIEDSHSYDLVPNPDIAYEGGKAYGWFVKALSDFPAGQLTETIPHFHDIDFRLQNFKTALKNDKAQRAKNVQTEIDFVVKRSQEMRLILQLGQTRKIPIRVTHNDTKINNVLFDANDKAISVIDLDTVMPGYIHYDFGDAIRTFTNTANEDEPDLSKVSINMEYFKAFARGFLQETKEVLRPEEIKHLAFSARLMTFIIGLRFLTDYLNGDTYFKTAYEQHNLVRTRVQFRLLESMEGHATEMQAFIEQL